MTLIVVTLVKTLGVGRRDWTRTNDPHHVKVLRFLLTMRVSERSMA